MKDYIYTLKNEDDSFVMLGLVQGTLGQAYEMSVSDQFSSPSESCLMTLSDLVQLNAALDKEIVKRLGYRP